MEKRDPILDNIMRRLVPIIKSAHKAKTHTTHEQRKVSSAKRCKKWKQINTRAIKEYHAWIEEELQKLKGGAKAHGRKKGK